MKLSLLLVLAACLLACEAKKRGNRKGRLQLYQIIDTSHMGSQRGSRKCHFA